MPAIDKWDAQHAQTYAILSVFTLIHHYHCFDGKSSAYVSKLASHRKTGRLGKVVFGRWFLLNFGNRFSDFATKSALKYLNGRRGKEKLEKRELSHYKPGEFTRKLRQKNKKTNQMDFDF